MVGLASSEIYLSDDEGLFAGLAPGENHFGDDYTREEYFLWLQNPSTSSMLCNQVPRRVSQRPLLDVGHNSLSKLCPLFSEQQLPENLTDSFDPPRPENEICDLMICNAPVDFRLQYSEQHILKQIQSAIGDKPTTELRLQFAPRWIVQKAIDNKRKTYELSEWCKEVYI